jgi:hypothetical protein
MRFSHFCDVDLSCGEPSQLAVEVVGPQRGCRLEQVLQERLRLRFQLHCGKNLRFVASAVFVRNVSSSSVGVQGNRDRLQHTLSHPPTSSCAGPPLLAPRWHEHMNETLAGSLSVARSDNKVLRPSHTRGLLFPACQLSKSQNCAWRCMKTCRRRYYIVGLEIHPGADPYQMVLEPPNNQTYPVVRHVGQPASPRPPCRAL